MRDDWLRWGLPLRRPSLWMIRFELCLCTTHPTPLTSTSTHPTPHRSMAQAGGAMPATSSSAAARASLSPEQPYPDQPEQDPPPQQPSRRIATSAATFAQKDGPTRKPEDSFRDDIARHIFGEKLGRIVDDYSCA